ncbi:MAG: M20/M25/M40 family metallo-hydrolase [Candidatus Woesearchaeota archaeon]
MDALQLAKDLVSIDSVIGNETECLVYIESFLNDNNIPFKRIPVETGRWCILATKGYPTLLMAGHIDTVPSEPHYKAYITETHLHGIGASDMKSGLAIMLKLLLEYKDIAFLVTVGEEGPLDGAKACMKKPELFEGLKMCILSEPTDLKLFASQFGLAPFNYETSAEQRHTALYAEGGHPVHEIIHALDPLIQGFQERFPESIISTNIFQAGTKSNIIPASAKAYVDVRVSPHDTLDKVASFIRRYVPKPDFYHLTLPVTVVETDFLKTAVDLLGPSHTISAFTEMYYYNKLGMQTIIFGPGLLDMAHKVGETVPLANMREYERLLARLLSKIL